MNRLFSVNFWVSPFVSTLFTIFVMWMIKRITSAVHIPVVSDVVGEVV